ncbi:MAG: cysteine hydrolase, partial [Lachnospiraceae bacterium]|nr:cysteine hydrolase [Lachnospiraceae bacterium]
LRILDEEYRSRAMVGLESVTFAGLCTDICVISNAMIAKAFIPEVPIIVDSACCAGVTPQSHEIALQAINWCHILFEYFNALYTAGVRMPAF